MRRIKFYMFYQIPIVIGALGKVSKALEKKQEELKMKGMIERIQANALLKLARILRNVLETWVGMLSLRLLWNTTCVKNSLVVE